MGVIGQVKVDFQTQYAEFTGGAKKAAESLDKVGESSRRTKHDVDGLRGAMEALKEQAGRGSTLDEFGKTIRGAGALMGVSLLGEELNKVSEKVGEINQKWRDGQIDASGVAVEIGKSLPVIGSFVSAGQNIREMFTHEQEQIGHINEDIKAGNELMEIRVKEHEKAAKTMEELADKIKKANQELAIARAGPEERKALEEQFKSQDIGDEAAAEYKAKEAARQEDLKKELEAIRKAGDARKKVLEDDAHDNLSFYDKHSYNDGAEQAVEDAKRLADAQADAVTNSQIKAAQERAKKELEILKQGLDDEAKLRQKAIVAGDVRKDIDSGIKSAAEGVKTFLDEIAKTGEKVNKELEETHKKAIEEAKKIAEEKAKIAAEAAKKAAEESAEAWKKEQEDAARIIEQSLTPLQKAQQEIERIQELYNENLLTEQQASAAIDRATKGLDDDKDKDRRSKAETRRFDFRLPADAREKDDAAKQLAQTAKQQLESQKQIEWYEQQQYQFALNDQQNTDIVTDLSSN